MWLILLYQMAEYSGMVLTEKRPRGAAGKFFLRPEYFCEVVYGEFCPGSVETNAVIRNHAGVFYGIES